jgi:hypothetical protein
VLCQTDPQNCDYSLEAGATRNFEALRTAERLAEQEIKEKEEEEKNNPMRVGIMCDVQTFIQIVFCGADFNSLC